MRRFSSSRILALCGALSLAVGVPLGAQFNGGYTNAGITGEYFANADLAGSPAFTRKETRLDFDWGAVLPVGGSIAEPYRSFPTDNFSVRYTGQLVPAHTQSHTFKLVADDGARLFLKPEGSSAWTTVIDAWSASGTHTGAIDLVAAQKYDIRIEYRELTGTAQLRLLWSSASVPEEVVDCLNHVGYNFESIWTQGFTDIVKGARGDFEPVATSGPKPAQDSLGWPQSDATYVLQESLHQGFDVDPLTRGTITFSFTGRGTVSLRGNATDASLTQSYHAGTNTTSGTFTLGNLGSNATWLTISDSDRDGQTPVRHNGFTNLRLMKPVAPDATTSYAPDTVFDPHFRDAVSAYTHLRLCVRNPTVERVWADRTTPGYFNQAQGRFNTNIYPVNGVTDRYPAMVSYEHQVMICNEAGRDLYLNIPMMADGWEPGDGGYVDKLARLIKFGSDGIEPYSAPQASPVYPPLNPNLRVYLEISNEVWNGWFPHFRQHQDIAEMIKEDIKAAVGGGSTDTHARPADFAIYNYDHLPLNNNGSMWRWRLRKLMLRVIQTSDIFRHYFGDAAMHTRVRPLYFWQYGNYNNTAKYGLTFADDYFNHADGIAHTPQAQPLSHWVWGGGGASYYGAVNPYGVTGQIGNSSFETPTVAAGSTPAPAGSGWTFSGAAGLARDGGDLDDVPPIAPDLGAQCAYIDGTGSIERTVTIPATQTSNVYAVVFRAVQRVPIGSGTADTQKLVLSIDGQPSNSISFNQDGTGFVPTQWNSEYPWESSVVSWTRGTTYYSSNAFTATPGQVITVRLTGAGDANQRAYIDDVRLGSVDELFADGMPGGGEAAGQPAGAVYQNDLNTQSAWANGFGLHYMTYEGSWSLGGDTHGSPMQNYAKDRSSQAADAQLLSLQMLAQAGGVANTLAYTQWTRWFQPLREEGLLNVHAYPLVQGHQRFLDGLADLPTYAEQVPCTIDWSNRILALGPTSAGVFTAHQWATFHLSVPAGGLYQVTFQSTGSGSLQLRLNDREILHDGAAGTITLPAVFLNRGINTLRLRGTSGSFTFGRITVTGLGVPGQATLTSLGSGDLAFTANWDAVSGATGYRLSYGTQPETYTHHIDLTAGQTSTTVTGLAHDTAYFLIVQAVNAHGLGLPSTEKSVIMLANGQVGRLAAWDLLAAGSVGGSTETCPVTACVKGLMASPLTRGLGFTGSDTWAVQTEGHFNFNQSMAYTTLDAAKAANHYVQWQITPESGRRVSVQEVAVALYHQETGTTPMGALEASLDGFATPGFAVGVPRPAGQTWIGQIGVFDATGLPALQDVTGRITFRLYPYNNKAWNDRGIGGIGGFNADVEIRGTVTSDDVPGAARFDGHP